MGRQILRVEFDYDFAIIALVTGLRDYRLCWFINKALDIDLQRQDDLEIHLPDKKTLARFSCFYAWNNLERKGIHCISNRSGNNRYLLPELKMIDFIVRISGCYEEQEIDDILEALKCIQQVQSAFRVEVENLRSKQNLILDEPEI